MRVMSWIRERLREGTNLQRLAGNSGWLFFDWVFRSVLGFVVGIWLARHLGPTDFGTFNYAIAFVSLFTAVATLGLDAVVIRDLARDTAGKDVILGSAFGLRLAGALLSVIAAAGCVALLKPGNTPILLLVAVIAAGGLFQSFDVVDFWFQSQVKSKYAVIARAVAATIAAAARIALIALGAALLAFAVTVSAELAIVAAGLIVAYHIQGNRIGTWRFSRSTAAALLSDSWPLILSGLALYIQARIDQVMLGEMLGDAEVGQYSVAMRLIETFSFAPMIIYSSVAPTVAQAKLEGENVYLERLTNIYRLMFIIFVLTALPIYIFSDTIVRLLYGDAYRQAGVLLSLFALRPLFANFGVARSLFITNENMFKHALMAAITGCLVNVGLNYWLIPLYRSAGAIIATMFSFLVTVFLFDLLSARARVNLRIMIRAMLTPWRLRVS